jgi:hypothetical protein
VIAIAKTPSLKASSRFVVIRRPGADRALLP